MPNSPMLLTLLSLTSGLVAASASSPIVALPYATFQGINDGNLTKFLGIPFSQPVARFDLPTPPQRLHGVQNATAFGAACPQQAFSPIPVFPLGAANYSAISEDCLTINVFKPSSASPKAKLPVFVVHPGGFEVGNSVDTDVVPVVKRSMAIGEPVIVVTPNYRLSAFGFLAGKEAAAAGITNLGLRDQIFALQWVQQHISAFGGDPTRVVVGGISAGAISVGMLLLSNRQHSNTLFHGAFMVSGSPFTVPTVADGQPFYDELVAANNCTGSRDSLQCLKNVPFDSGNHAWRPRLDGDIIVQDPMISVSDGSFAKIPIVTGDDDDEGTLKPDYLCGLFSLSTTNITTNAEFLDYINSNYIPLATRAQIQKLGLLYPDDPTQVRDALSNSPRTLTEPEFKRLAAFQGDHSFIANRRFFLEHASGRQNTWSYLIKRGKSTPFLGAVHGGDIGIWFLRNSNDTTGADILVNFINTLDPNRSAAPNSGARLPVFWPKWKTASRALLTLSDPGI
ncbi:sterol esterase, partial [Mycena rebaudengoi]